MKSLASKRIFSLIIAIAMIVAPMSATVFAAMPAATQAESQKVVAPDLSALENPVAPPSRATGSPVKIVDNGGVRVTLGKDFDLTGAKMLSLRGRSGVLERQGTVWQNVNIGETETFIVDYDTGATKELTFVYQSAHCQIYLDDSLTNISVHFRSELANIAAEFETIYAMESVSSSNNFVGEPWFYGADYPIVIALYDIGDDGAIYTGNSYIGGFFSPNDYFQYGNEAPIINVDIGGYQGYWMNLNRTSDWYGTIAHEYQHLIHFSQYLKNVVEGNISYDPADPDRIPGSMLSDGTPLPTIWSNEGISGAVDILYSGAMSQDHRDFYLLNDFASGVGYVPTTYGWYMDADDQVLSNYGASALLMSEYNQYGKSFNAVVTDGRVGYIKGNEKVGEHFWGVGTGKGFDDFFTLAALDMAVDTPDSTYDAVLAATGGVAYRNAAIDNMWQARKAAMTGGYEQDAPWTAGRFAGVTDINIGDTVSVTNNSATYFSSLYLSQAGASGAVDISVPASNAGKYYIIYPYNGTNVNNDTDWISAGKIAKELVNSDIANTVTVGSNNYFAILVVNHGTTINENFSFSNSAFSITNLTTTPSEPEQGEVVNGTFDIVNPGTTVLTINEISVLKADGTVVAGGTLGTPINISANTTQSGITFMIPAADADPGEYKVKAVSAGGDEVFSQPFHISVKGELTSPVGTNVSVGTDTISLGFSIDVSASNGNVVLSGTDSYTAQIGDTALDTHDIPLSSFKNSANESPVFLYGETWTVSLEADAVVDEFGTPNKASTPHLGTFTIESAPVGVISVLPGTSLEVPKGTSKLLHVYFGGASTEIESATITGGDEAYVTINDPATITADGAFSVYGVEVTDSPVTLSIGFSSAIDHAPIEIAVTVTGTPNPPPVGPYEPGYSDDSSDSGSGGSGSGIGGGGGGLAADVTIDVATANRYTQGPISRAVSSGSDTAVVTFRNVNGFTKESLKAMADSAKKAGVKLLVNADVVENGVIILRITFNPADATKAFKVGGSLKSNTAKNVAKKFGLAFPDNNISVLSLNQIGGFGMQVHIAVKADLAKLNTKSLAVSYYDMAANRFEYLNNPGIFIDKNNYLHYDTIWGGSHITSDSPFRIK